MFESIRALLAEANISSALSNSEPHYLLLESNAILGFVFIFPTATQLIENWERDTAKAIETHSLSLRRAGAKAWNTYLILLAEAQPTPAETVQLSGIEENLRNTRKVARAGVNDAVKLRNALLQLLPIQHAPRLDFIDMSSEIRLRTTELPTELVAAFLSPANPNVLAQVFEDFK